MPEHAAKDGYVKGSLTQVPFPKVLNYINMAGKSGILALSQGKRKVHIHFDRGEIGYVTSSYLPEMSLGEYLVKEGKISADVHEESIAATRSDRVKQGAYLVEKGHLSPHDLYEALNKQVMMKLFKLFGWTEGEFFFREGEIIGEEHRILNISFPNLLYRGIRNYMPLDRPPMEFRGRKEDVLVKRFAGRYKIEDLKLGPAETRIYNLINGERTLRQIVTAANVNKAIAYKVLYALFLLELVGFPEAYRSDRISHQAKERREPAKRGEGFEIRIANDLIAEAMASVDRIREEVQHDETVAALDVGAEGAMGAPGASKAFADDFMTMVDKTLRKPTAGAVDYVGPAVPTPEAPTRVEADPFAMPRGATDPFQDISLEPPAPLKSEGGLEGADDFGLGEGATDAEMARDEDEITTESLLMDIEDYSNPEDLVKQAGFLLDDGKWLDARRFLKKAIELDENYADAYALLGWAVFNDPSDMDNKLEGERLIKKGLRLNPGRYLHFLYLGKVYSALGQYEFAELHFVKALELNIECSEAKEEIKRIHHR